MFNQLQSQLPKLSSAQERFLKQVSINTVDILFYFKEFNKTKKCLLTKFYGFFCRYNPKIKYQNRRKMQNRYHQHIGV